jgi:NADH-ubiquinone oxidoreductase chain 1
MLKRFTTNLSLCIIEASIIISVLVNVVYFVLLDRLIMASAQRRSGPYVVGWFGSAQSVGDGIKLWLKRTTSPQKSNGAMFIISPILIFSFSLSL